MTKQVSSFISDIGSAISNPIKALKESSFGLLGDPLDPLGMKMKKPLVPEAASVAVSPAQAAAQTTQNFDTRAQDIESRRRAAGGVLDTGNAVGALGYTSASKRIGAARKTLGGE